MRIIKETENISPGASSGKEIDPGQNLSPSLRGCMLVLVDRRVLALQHEVIEVKGRAFDAADKDNNEMLDLYETMEYDGSLDFYFK